MLYEIDPLPALRMVKSDSYANPRPAVLRYRAYQDEVRLRRVLVTDRVGLRFNLAMPQSWSMKKREAMNMAPHQQRPDLDNLIKALLDAVFLYQNDSVVHEVHAMKCWGWSGSIEVWAL